MTQRHVAVIGAGAAGIIAAWRAATLGARVILLEKNPRIGTKILISGGGKCNITHDGDIEPLLSAFRPNEARFLRPTCYGFTNREVIELFTARGLDVYARPDGRIFPVSGTAKDVVSILSGYLEDAHIDVRLTSPVSRIEADSGGIVGVTVGGCTLASRHVILASGGSSYPGTGTTGDGWPWARDLGHRIVKIRAALAPIFLELPPPPEWPGIAIRDCILKARQNRREIARWRGDLLFTHRGVSGPTALGISRVVAEKQRDGDISLEVDILPDLGFEALSAAIRTWTADHPRRSIATMLEGYVPNRLAEPILAAAAVAPHSTGAYLNRKEQNRLVETLKAWRLGRAEHVPLEKGEVVAGGVALDEVDPHSMRSKVIRGLYICGEALDIAGPVGGYNLQAAFSTGYVAGESAAVDLLKEESGSSAAK